MADSDDTTSFTRVRKLPLSILIVFLLSLSFSLSAVAIAALMANPVNSSNTLAAAVFWLESEAVQRSSVTPVREKVPWETLQDILSGALPAPIKSLRLNSTALIATYFFEFDRINNETFLYIVDIISIAYNILKNTP